VICPDSSRFTKNWQQNGFNRRTFRSPGMLFYRLLQQALATAPVTYDDVVRKTSSERRSAWWSESDTPSIDAVCGVVPR
jgi:hypothetical protein